MNPIGSAALLAYGLLRAPLALLELPLFVLLPAYYATHLGMELALIGTVLFGARLIDALADPAIGVMIDRSERADAYRRWILGALPLLALGYLALFHPPAGMNRAAWLAVMSILTYLAYSAVSIAYQAWGARLGNTPVERMRVTAWREAAGLAGVLLSAALLVPERANWLVALFILTAGLAAMAIFRAPLPGPRERNDNQSERTLMSGLAQAGQAMRSSPSFGWLLAAFLCNGIASAIPATLVLFFVADVLGAADRAPGFLIAYFVAAAIGMPAWVRIARRLGLRNAWLAGMGLSVLAFCWAFVLGEGDTAAFLAVCIATGFALGADLAVPPALLATVLASDASQQAREGAFFGVWNLATKINLAAAAGLALPLLGLLAYRPGEAGGNTQALSIIYALLPCALKILAGVVLLRAPLPPSALRPYPEPTP